MSISDRARELCERLRASSVHHADLKNEAADFIEHALSSPPNVGEGACDLCAGECRGHSLGRPEEWEPEPGSRAYTPPPDRVKAALEWHRPSAPPMQDDAKLIGRLRELLEKATEGPWQINGVRGRGAHISHRARFHDIGPDGTGVAAVWFDEKTGLGFIDAKLIVEAVNALPALLDRLSTLSRDREDIRREAFDEAAKVADDANGERTYHEPTDWAYGAQDACGLIAKRIRALKETSA